MIDISDLNIDADSFVRSSSYEAVKHAVLRIKNAERRYLELYNALVRADMIEKAGELDLDLKDLALIRYNLELREMELKKKEAKG